MFAVFGVSSLGAPPSLLSGHAEGTCVCGMGSGGWASCVAALLERILAHTIAKAHLDLLSQPFRSTFREWWCAHCQSRTINKSVFIRVKLRLGSLSKTNVFSWKSNSAGQIGIFKLLIEVEHTYRKVHTPKMYRLVNLCKVNTPILPRWLLPRSRSRTLMVLLRTPYLLLVTSALRYSHNLSTLHINYACSFCFTIWYTIYLVINMDSLLCNIIDVFQNYSKTYSTIQPRRRQ